MATITFHHEGADDDVVEVPEGTSIMRAAVTNGVAGIVGECGGQAMCATCHIYVRDEYLDALPPISDDEEEMLECATAPVLDDRSRLGCQIKLGGDLTTVEVDVPASQV